MSFLKNMTWSPSDYAKAAVIAREAGDELIARLDWVTLQPQVILDVGTGTGEMALALQKKYPEATVWAVDHAESMIDHIKQHTSLSCICAEASNLPFPDFSVDLISANFLLPWATDLQSLFSEWRRVLRPDGLLMFTSLGPDTCKEWRGIISDDYLPSRIDMHDVGDLLLSEGFADPVLDVNHFTLSYRQKELLIKEAHASGMLLQLPPDSLHAILPTEEGTWPLTFEVVYGHTFGAQINESKTVDGVTKIPLSSLRNQIKNKSS